MPNGKIRSLVERKRRHKAKFGSLKGFTKIPKRKRREV